MQLDLLHQRVCFPVAAQHCRHDDQCTAGVGYAVGALLCGAESRSGGRLTDTGLALGTPGYMSPEQAAGERNIDARADVYALAVVGYEMLAEVQRDLTPEQAAQAAAGDSSGVLIGRRGQMLDALEYLLNRVAGRDEGGSARIVVDSENYRARRREALEELARRMGEQAKKKRKAVTLNPMSPRDRRIVHLILQEDSSLVTKSSGKGYFRKLIIIPAGMVKSRRGPAEGE